MAMIIKVEQRRIGRGKLRAITTEIETEALF